MLNECEFLSSDDMCPKVVQVCDVWLKHHIVFYQQTYWDLIYQENNPPIQSENPTFLAYYWVV